MDAEHREAIREANRRRSKCPQCHSGIPQVVDGRDVGGLDGLKYRRCNTCGWTQAITRKTRKPSL
jgi:formate dehydrogenase maturation protein FdhE